MPRFFTCFGVIQAWNCTKTKGFHKVPRKCPVFLRVLGSFRPGIAQKHWVFIGFPESALCFYMFCGHSGLFVTIFRLCWGPPQPALENGSEWLPGSLFRVNFRLCLGFPQPALKNGLEWLPGGIFRDCFRFFLGSPQPAFENGSEWLKNREFS